MGVVNAAGGALCAAAAAMLMCGCGSDGQVSAPSSVTAAAQQQVLDQMGAQHAAAVASGDYGRTLDALRRKAAAAAASGQPVAGVSSLAALLSTPPANAGTGWTMQTVPVVLPSPTVTASEAPPAGEGGVVSQSFPSWLGVTVVPAYDGKVWSATLRSPTGDVCATFADGDQFAYTVASGACPVQDTADALDALQVLGSS